MASRAVNAVLVLDTNGKQLGSLSVRCGMHVGDPSLRAMGAQIDHPIGVHIDQPSKQVIVTQVPPRCGCCGGVSQRLPCVQDDAGGVVRSFDLASLRQKWDSSSKAAVVMMGALSLAHACLHNQSRSATALASACLAASCMLFAPSLLAVVFSS